MAISLEEVRRRILIALFSDDYLLETLVLKGGNALAIVHKVGSRASLDMDFSVEAAFAELEKVQTRIFDTLRKEFASAGYELFDETFQKKPSQVSSPERPEWWGGYIAEFKIAARSVYDKFRNDLEALRRNSEVLGPAQRRKYSIDISHHEFCEGKVRREIDDYIIYVYSLEMIAAEKIRAICQQMPEYEVNRTKSPRARDFYDVYQIVADNQIDLTQPNNLKTLVSIFDAKRVPLNLLRKIKDQKDFHALDWPSVTASISGEHHDFDFYFDFIAKLADQLLNTLGIK